jgi:cell division protein FtsB
MMDHSTAEEYLALRRDVAGLKQALRVQEETSDALRRRNEQLERHLRLVQTEIQRVGLVAAKDW